MVFILTFSHVFQLYRDFWVGVIIIVDDYILNVKCSRAITVMFICFNLCSCIISDIISCSFTPISCLTNLRMTVRGKRVPTTIANWRLNPRPWMAIWEVKLDVGMIYRDMNECRGVRPLARSLWPLTIRPPRPFKLDDKLGVKSESYIQTFWSSLKPTWIYFIYILM